MNRFPLIFLITLITASCGEKNTSPQNREEAKLEFFENVFNEINIKSQLFEIDPNRDTLLIGDKGTQIKIFANNFLIPTEDTSKTISIELKEVTRHADWVLGNLTTIESFPINYKQLEPIICEKMLYVNALSNGVSLDIDTSIGLGIIIPTDTVQENLLSIRKGINNDTLMRWEPIENVSIENTNAMNAAIYKLVKYRITSKNYPNEDLSRSDLMDQANNQLTRWVYHPSRRVGDTLMHDTLYYALQTANDTTSFDVHFSYVQDIWLDSNALFNFGDYSNFVRDAVWRNCNTDNNDFLQTNYLLRINETGWISLMRPIYFPMEDNHLRAASVILEVENGSDFDFVYTSLLFNDGNVYIPGHERKNGTFDFFLDFDYEARENAYRSFPKGNATVIVSAYKDGKPYFGMHQFTMESENSISCNLERTSLLKIKEILLEICDD